jgi:hypothetical protein
MTTSVPTSRGQQVLEPAVVQRLSEGLVAFLETNTPPDGLFQADLFCDLSLPQWRLQTDSAEAIVRVRRESHPDLGRVSHWRSDATVDGFVFEFAERWTDAAGGRWYAREMIRARVGDAGGISEMSIYCTGDWDQARQAEHARAVQLVRAEA